MLAMDNHSFDSPNELVKKQGLNVLRLNIIVSGLHFCEVTRQAGAQLVLLSEREFGLYCSHLMRRLQRHFETSPPYLTK